MKDFAEPTALVDVSFWYDNPRQARQHGRLAAQLCRNLRRVPGSNRLSRRPMRGIALELLSTFEALKSRCPVGVFRSALTVFGVSALDLSEGRVSLLARGDQLTGAPIVMAITQSCCTALFNHYYNRFIYDNGTVQY